MALESSPVQTNRSSPDLDPSSALILPRAYAAVQASSLDPSAVQPILPSSRLLVIFD